MTSSSESGEHDLFSDLIGPPVAKSRAELRLEAAERYLKNEIRRVDDEETIRLALLAGYNAARATGLTDREVFARLCGVDSATWYSWQQPRRPVAPGSRPKRIPSWVVASMLRVCDESRSAFLNALSRPTEMRRAG
jgi:hypothetical protein